MSSRDSRRRLFIGGAVAMLLAVVTVGGVAVRQAWGDDANLGEGLDAQGGSCADPNNSGTYWDTCYGATWRYYTDLDSEGYKRASAMKSTENAPAVDIGPCREEVTTTTNVTDPATGVVSPVTTTSYKIWSGYFRLGLQSYTPSIYYKTDDPQAAYVDGQVGVNQNGELCVVRNVSPPGCTRFKVVGGSLSLEDTFKFYTIALSHAKAVPPGAVWDQNLGWFCYDTSWGSAPSASTTPTIPTGGGGGGGGDVVGEFVSLSTVQSDKSYNPGATPAVSTHSVTSPEDGTATLYLSTDAENFTGRFSHEIKYHPPSAGGNYDAVSVNWYTKYSIDGGPEMNTKTELEPKSGTIYRIPGGSEYASGEIADSVDFRTVHLDEGQTVTVCETIYYEHKYQYFHFDNLGYIITGASDTGSSKACYKVTRPADPEDEEPGSLSHGKSTSGEPESGVKYAGEVSEVSWKNVKATNYATRRLAEMQEIVYAIPTLNVYRDNSSDFTGNRTATARVRTTPCQWYQNGTGQQAGWAAGAGCAVLGKSTFAVSENTGTDLNKGTLVRGYDTENGGYIQNATLNKVRTQKNTSDNRYPSQNMRNDIVVPDYVGYKYCNANGWRYIYYYGAETRDKSGNGKITWAQEEGGNKYNWITGDAACRTIAKKPSVSVWNGSIMSNGGAITSLSGRYDETRIMFVNNNGRTVPAITDDNLQREFGSWSEYLAVFNKPVSGLTSGSSLALGNKNVGDIWTSYSPLTVANIALVSGSFDSANKLGNSGITSNTTLRTRLNTFLRDRDEAVKVDCADKESGTCSTDDLKSKIGVSSLSAVTGHRIFNVSGNLRVSEDIKLATVPYSSIYDVPQVVIFVSGNVEITSNVTQIDAWLIVGDAGNSNNGRINTCSEYEDSNKDRVGTDADAWTQRSAEGSCRKQLAFNGPVIANSLELNRSYGSDNIVTRSSAYDGSVRSNLRDQTDRPSFKYSPGEIFNYRTDSYLWAYAQAGRYDSSYTETYSRELAPRY